MSAPQHPAHAQVPHVLAAEPSRSRPSSIEHELPKVGKIVFCVQGIPLEVTLEGLEKSFKSHFKSSNSQENTIDTGLSSLVPCCYGSGHQTALIQFQPQTPKCLESLVPGRCYDFEDPDFQCRITIDQDFMGSTQLYPTISNLRIEAE
jgi:hypothetical protein